MTRMGDCSPVISAAILRASNVIVPNNAGRGEPDFGALPRAERTEGRHGLALFDPGLILESVTSPGTVKVNFANYRQHLSYTLWENGKTWPRPIPIVFVGGAGE